MIYTVTLTRPWTTWCGCPRWSWAGEPHRERGGAAGGKRANVSRALRQLESVALGFVAGYTGKRH